MVDKPERNPQGHSPKYWRKHPAAFLGQEKKEAVVSRDTPRGFEYNGLISSTRLFDPTLGRPRVRMEYPGPQYRENPLRKHIRQ